MNSRWAMLGVIFVTRLSMGIHFQSIASVAPPLVNDLHIAYGQVGWLMGCSCCPARRSRIPAACSAAASARGASCSWRSRS